MASKLPLEFVDTEGLFMPFPLQHTKRHQAAGDMMQLGPLRARKFLDYAAERILLRKVGGGYMFTHRLLQDYFTACHSEPSDATDQESSG